MLRWLAHYKQRNIFWFTSEKECPTEDGAGGILCCRSDEMGINSIGRFSALTDGEESLTTITLSSPSWRHQETTTKCVLCWGCSVCARDVFFCSDGFLPPANHRACLIIPLFRLCHRRCIDRARFCSHQLESAIPFKWTQHWKPYHIVSDDLFIFLSFTKEKHTALWISEGQFQGQFFCYFSPHCYCPPVGYTVCPYICLWVPTCVALFLSLSLSLSLSVCSMAVKEAICFLPLFDSRPRWGYGHAPLAFEHALIIFQFPWIPWTWQSVCKMMSVLQWWLS